MVKPRLCETIDFGSAAETVPVLDASANWLARWGQREQAGRPANSTPAWCVGGGAGRPGLPGTLTVFGGRRLPNWLVMKRPIVSA